MHSDGGDCGIRDFFDLLPWPEMSAGPRFSPAFTPVNRMKGSPPASTLQSTENVRIFSTCFASTRKKT